MKELNIGLGKLKPSISAGFTFSEKKAKHALDILPEPLSAKKYKC